MSDPPDSGYGAPLAGMVGTQMAAAAALSSVPVLAPEIAASAGLDPGLVGVYIGTCFAAAMVGSAACVGAMARFGAVRINQLAIVGCGLAVVLTGFSTVPMLIVSALLLGAAYGPNTPSGSQVLARLVPLRRRALAFSVKQSGAPLGAMLAGAVLPAVAALWGWRAAMVVVLAASIVAALCVQPLRRRVDTVAPAVAGETPRPSTLSALRIVWRTPVLRRLSVGGFLLMVVHGCYQTFLVVYLVEEVELGLAAAGGIYAVLQAAAAISRVLLGWLVDRLGEARLTLIAVACVALASSLTVATFSPAWPPWQMGAVCLVAGIGSSGWYGVFLAELARRAPAGDAGTATAGALFFIYFAIVAGPLAIAGLVAIAGSYVPAFVLAAGLAGVAAIGFDRMRDR